MDDYKHYSYPGSSRERTYSAESNGTLRGLSKAYSKHDIQILGVQSASMKAPVERRKVANRADRAISNFQIEFDNGQKYQPGTDIVGKVTMDVWSAIDIRYLEFIIHGKATVRQFKESSNSMTFSQRPQTEIHLNKRILLLSPQDGQASIVLTPGKYVSSFVYKLPSNIPPTVDQTEVSQNGHVFNISYMAQANICDFLNTKDASQRERYAQIIKSTRRSFTVVPELDYQSLPGALDPMTHAEQFSIGLSLVNSNPTSILVKLDHQVYSVGDIIGLHLEIQTPDTDRIGNITADFEQHIILKGDSTKRFNRNIVRAIDDPHQRRYRVGSKAVQNGTSSRREGKLKKLYKTGFKIPIHKTVASLLPHSKLISIYYVMNVLIKFTNFGGTVQMHIPVTLAPAMDPDVLAASHSKTNIPVFNKPIMQFNPSFTRNILRDSSHSVKSAATSLGSTESLWKVAANGGNKNKRKTTKHEKVKITYKNCFGF